MAQIIINIPNDKLSRVIDALCSLHGYRATLLDGTANPETKQQFAKRKIIEKIKDDVRSIELSSSYATSQQTINDSVNLIDIT